VIIVESQTLGNSAETSW